jgi:crotonobetainyl-CoA:carnitine CoA-transferase CaiB-like acyl-CoA transferase
MTFASRPLAGFRVIDFSTLVAGPWATRLLADCGADVIKIEAAHEGDVLRHSSPFPGGVSRTFAHFNCGKRCVALDLKSAAGVALARRLIERSDVVVENFRPGVMARLGLDYARVAAANPRLVYCSVSGFGQDGPMSQQAAYAPIVHALSGFDVAMLRAQSGQGEPLASGVMIADVVAASYAFGAIQTALLRRERDGNGAHIDATLIEAMLSLVAIQIQEAQAPVPVAPKVFRPTRTADGHVIVPLVSARNYLALYPVIGRPEWCGDSSFTSLRGILARTREIEDALRAWAEARKTDDVVAAIVAAGLPCSRYRAPEEVLGDEHLVQRGSLAPLADSRGEFVVINPPFRFTDATIAAQPSVGALGEHTREVLRSVLGIGDAELAAAASSGAFGAERT